MFLLMLNIYWDFFFQNFYQECIQFMHYFINRYFISDCNIVHKLQLHMWRETDMILLFNVVVCETVSAFENYINWIVGSSVCNTVSCPGFCQESDPLYAVSVGHTIQCPQLLWRVWQCGSRHDRYCWFNLLLQNTACKFIWDSETSVFLSFVVRTKYLGNGLA